MMKAVITDFSRVLLFPKDDAFTSGLNALNNQLLDDDPEYDFWQYFKINHELLDYYKSLNIPVYIFTSETIQDHPAVKKLLENTFKDVFSAKKLGLNKKEASSYKHLAKLLGHTPSEIFYIDDNHENFTAAKKAGCKAILFKTNDDVIDKLEIVLADIIKIMIFLTGAANVGKTSLVNQLKQKLPATKFDIHDIDETGRWSGDYVAWRNEKIEHWLHQSIVNSRSGIQTILCGIIFPADVCKLPSYSDATAVAYILLDANEDDIYSRFQQKRLKNGNKLFQDNGALHVAAQVEVAKRLKKSVQQNHGIIIDTHNKTKNEVARQVLESIPQLLE